MINIKFLFSPLFALFVTFITSILAVLPSEDFYRSNFGEKSLVTYSLTVLSWVSLCSLMYLLGLYTASRFGVRKVARRNSEFLYMESKRSEFKVMLLCIFAILINLYGILQLYKAFGLLGILNTMLGVGSVDLRLAVYYALKAVNTGWAIAFTVPVACVVYTIIVRTKNRLLKILFVILITVHLILILATQSKGPIFTLIISIVICTQMIKFPRLFIRRGIVFRFAAILLFLLFVFLAIQYRRNPDILSINGLFKEISAYTFVSYNRLAYLLDGQLNVPNMDMGFWTNRWFWGLPGDLYTNKILHSLQFDIPYDAFSAWIDTFKAVLSAKLNDHYIWVTIYGEAFADYKWFGFLWFFIYGLLSQFAYRDMVAGYLRSYAIYPFVLQCNFGWYSGATIGTREILFCFLIALYLSIKNVRLLEHPFKNFQIPINMEKRGLKG